MRNARIRRGSGAAFLAVGCFLVFSPAAWGQSLTGGCSATVNGRAPQSMTQDHPLEVQKGGSVAVRGSVPSSVSSLPKNRIRSVTEIKVAIIEGILEPTIKTVHGRGATWGGSADVPGAISDIAPGIYKVSGVAKGSPNWGCEGSGYIDIKGGPATPAAAAGAGLTLVGGGLALSARGRKRRGSDAANDPKVRRAVEKSTGSAVMTAIKEVIADMKANGGVDAAVLIVAILFIILFMIGAIDIPAVILVPMLAMTADSSSGESTRVWVRGHVVRGFVGGLIAGIGLALLFQQLDVWILNTGTAIVLPVGLAILFAARARIGRPYLVRLGSPSAG